MKDKTAAALTNPSIPAKAGISAAKPHSPKATIAMFRFAENSRCRENEIPAFAGMEGGGAAKLKAFPFPPLIPIPAKAGISPNL